MLGAGKEVYFAMGFSLHRESLEIQLIGKVT